MPTGTRSRIRELINAEKLVIRAQDSVLGKGKPLTTGEVGVIKLLLNKVLPDIKAIEHSGIVDSEGNVTHTVVFK